LIENKLKKSKLIIENVTTIAVSTENELNDIIYKGTLKRNTNSTTMKEYTSKSHNIIIVTIYRYYKDKNCMRTGTLYLCDLEGSEKITKMNPVEGENIEEQKLINKSLSALGSVVQSLSIKNDTTFHVPYRDSKLTRILSECLGGSAYTTLILTCTQNEYNLSETRNTLLFGERAKKIRNRPVVNYELNADKNPIMREVLNQRNELLNNLDEKERSAQKALEYKKMYENEINGLKSQIKQLKENHDMDLNVIEELKENINMLEADKQNMLDARDQLANKENEIRELNQKIKNMKKKEEKNEETIEKLKEDGNKLRKANESIKYLEMEKEGYIQQIEEKENEIIN
jgi:kinesin family protein 5